VNSRVITRQRLRNAASFALFIGIVDCIPVVRAGDLAPGAAGSGDSYFVAPYQVDDRVRGQTVTERETPFELRGYDPIADRDPDGNFIGRDVIFRGTLTDRVVRETDTGHLPLSTPPEP